MSTVRTCIAQPKSFEIALAYLVSEKSVTKLLFKFSCLVFYSSAFFLKMIRSSIVATSTVAVLFAVSTSKCLPVEAEMQFNHSTPLDGENIAVQDLKLSEELRSRPQQTPSPLTRLGIIFVAMALGFAAILCYASFKSHLRGTTNAITGRRLATRGSISCPVSRTSLQSTIDVPVDALDAHLKFDGVDTSRGFFFLHMPCLNSFMGLRCDLSKAITCHCHVL